MLSIVHMLLKNTEEIVFNVVNGTVHRGCGQVLFQQMEISYYLNIQSIGGETFFIPYVLF